MLKDSIDILLDKLLGTGYTEIHVIFTLGIMIIIILLFKGVRKR